MYSLFKSIQVSYIILHCYFQGLPPFVHHAWLTGYCNAGLHPEGHGCVSMLVLMDIK